VYFPADKAKNTRPCGSPVEATGSGGQTAQAGRYLRKQVEGRPGSCGVAAAGEWPNRGLSHAGHYFEKWKE